MQSSSYAYYTANSLHKLLGYEPKGRRLQELLYQEYDEETTIRERKQKDAPISSKTETPIPQICYLWSPENTKHRIHAYSTAGHTIKLRNTAARAAQGRIDTEKITGADHSEEEVRTERFRRIAVAQNEEQWIAKFKLYEAGVFDKLTKADMKSQAKLSESFVVDHRQVLYYKPHQLKESEVQLRLVVPQRLREDVLTAYHDELGAGAHQGVTKTYRKIKRY